MDISPQLNIAEALKIATTHHQAGRLPQAEQIYRQVLKQQPQQVEALNLLGVIACQYGRLDEGIALYRQALTLKPGFTLARENLCLALAKLGRQLTDEAIATYTQIVTFEPNNIPAHENLGNLLVNQNKLDEALAFYQHGLSRQPDNPRLLNYMGAVLQQQGKTNLAISYHRRALAIQPDYADALTGLGSALQSQGNMAEAKDCLDRAVTLAPTSPTAHYNRALVYLYRGDYKLGFEEYEWRFKTDEFPPCPFSQPVWDGKPLQGKTLLLHAEQGMGDTIQFIRYAAIAAQMGGRLVLTCHDGLIKLLSALPEMGEVVPLGFPVPEFHTYAPLMSLPRILGTTIDTIPNQVPYLPVLPSPLKLETPPSTRLKVGIVWSGGHLYKRNASRSCPLIYFQGLLQIPNIAFYSLQKGITQTELQELGWSSLVTDLSPQLGDMADTAAAIDQLDLVITVDTSVAHLAGALGKPVWTLLAHLPDWRWMLEREDSPWYPTMRLFRQPQPGDWEGVLQAVEKALREEVER